MKNNPSSNRGLATLITEHLQAFFNAHQGDIKTQNLYYQVLEQIERPLIQVTLEQVGGHQLRAAAILGLNRNTLRKKIRELGIRLKYQK